MRVLPFAIGLTLVIAGTSLAQASGNPGGTDQRQTASSSYQPANRSAFFLPPADPAEISALRATGSHPEFSFQERVRGRPSCRRLCRDDARNTSSRGAFVRVAAIGSACCRLPPADPSMRT